MRELKDQTLFDKRLLARHLKAGLVTQEQIDKHMADIADVAEQSETTDLDVLRAELRGGTPAVDEPAPEA